MNEQNININEYINNWEKILNDNSLDIISNSREFVVSLLADITNSSIADIKLQKITLKNEDITKMNDIIYKIIKEKIPPQYLTNVSYIYLQKFFVNESVLIPRQDTETLIEEAIKIINNNKFSVALDLCTGSGIIGISLACFSNISSVVLVDISKEALEVAKINKEKLDILNKCKIIQSNMFETLYKIQKKYDIIVSNPPYLKKSEMQNLSQFVKKEPVLALLGGNDGLKYYRIIYEKARDFLNDNGIIIVEIGCAQALEVIEIISKYSEYKDIRVIKDINNKDRVIVCRFQKK